MSAVDINVEADTVEWDDPIEPWDLTVPVIELPRKTLPDILDALAFENPAFRYPLAVSAAALPVIANAIGLGIRVAVNDEWSYSPLYWTLLTSPPGGAKTPTINFVAKPQTEREGRTQAEYKDVCRAAKAEKKEEPPAPERYITNDPTVAKLSEILSNQDHGILILNDEIGAVIGQLDNAGKSDKAPDRSAFIAGFEGNPYNVDRIVRMAHVKRWGFNILGATTTDNIKKMFANATVDGLLARMSVVSLPRMAPTRTLPTSSKVQPEYGRVLDRLYTLRNWNHRIPLSPGALDLFGKYHEAFHIERDLYAEELPRYSERVVKGDQIVCRLALIFELLKRAQQLSGPFTPADLPDTISAATMESAHAYARCIFDADRMFYESLKGTPSPEFELAKKLCNAILRHSWTEVAVGDFTRNVREFKDEKPRVRIAALDHLELLNWTRSDYAWNNGHSIAHGTKWQVNPRIHELYRTRAAMLREMSAASMQRIAASAAARREQREL